MTSRARATILLTRLLCFTALLSLFALALCFVDNCRSLQTPSTRLPTCKAFVRPAQSAQPLSRDFHTCTSLAPAGSPLPPSRHPTHCGSPTRRTANLKILSLGRNNIKSMGGLVSFVSPAGCAKCACACVLCFPAIVSDHSPSPCLFWLAGRRRTTTATTTTTATQEAVSGTLEELWISYNLIEKTSGVECLKNLKVRVNGRLPCRRRGYRGVDIG